MSNFVKKYWQYKDEKLLHAAVTQSDVLDSNNGAVHKCCRKSQCLLKNFVDEDGLYDTKNCLKFVMDCRKQYVGKSADQIETFIYELYRRCMTGSTNIKKKDAPRWAFILEYIF